MQNKIELYRFRDKMIDEVKSFFWWWNKKHREDPMNYPMEMTEDQWHDQYLAWKNLKRS